MYRVATIKIISTTLDMYNVHDRSPIN